MANPARMPNGTRISKIGMTDHTPWEAVDQLDISALLNAFMPTGNRYPRKIPAMTTVMIAANISLVDISIIPMRINYLKFLGEIPLYGI
ncbi:MAG TPA: hypothetical protein VKN74_02020 [Candidatus Mcinerneyibacterium sp.]|nr:hypothetical protein [Candidatus Mcinerneyibacterium sp.]